MFDTPGNRVTSLSSFSIALLTLSLILPRFLPESEGFAGATEAALIFLIILAGAVVLALYVLVIAASQHQSLTLRHRIYAVMPAFLMCLSGAIIYSLR